MADKRRQVAFEHEKRLEVRIFSHLTANQLKEIEGIKFVYDNGPNGILVTIDPRWDLADVKAEIERLAQPKTRKRRVRDVKREIEAELFVRRSPYNLTASIHNPFTDVIITDLYGHTGHGFAACCWLDKFDPAMGLKIAIGRAALDLAEQIVEAENG